MVICGSVAWAQGPAVRIAKPAEGEAVSGVCAIAVEVSKHPDVTHVVVYIGDQPLGNDFEPPYRILWDTRWAPNGPARLVAKALGERFVVAESAPRSLVVDNVPPAATLTQPAAEAIVGKVVELSASATDDVAIASVRFLVNGVQLEEVVQPPYRATWDTAKGPNGRFAVEARAFDTAGNDTLSTAVIVRVANPNLPPVLQKIGSQTVAEGQTLQLSIHASDPEAPRDTVTVTVTHLPEWATYNPRTLTISGVPPSSEASLLRPANTYSGVRVEACDPEPLCVHEDLSITVTDVNRPPTMTGPGDRTLNEGQLLAFPILRSDPDGDVLTCSADRIPQWLVFDDVRCTFDGTPDFEVATLKEPVKAFPTMTITVCDPGALCVSHRMIITVKNVDTSPHLAPMGPQVVDEDRELRLRIAATDANADLVFLNVSPLPEGARFTDHKDGTGEFVWVPRVDQGGAYELTVTATDGELIDEEIVPVTVRQASLAISGYTFARDGQTPRPGTEMQIHHGGDPIQKVTTDSRGFFLVRNLRPGTYTVTAHYDYKYEFSGQARTRENVLIAPTRYSVTLVDNDFTKVAFTIILPEDQ